MMCSRRVYNNDNLVTVKIAEILFRGIFEFELKQKYETAKLFIRLWVRYRVSYNKEWMRGFLDVLVLCLCELSNKNDDVLQKSYWNTKFTQKYLNKNPHKARHWKINDIWFRYSVWGLNTLKTFRNIIPHLTNTHPQLFSITSCYWTWR